MYTKSIYNVHIYTKLKLKCFFSEVIYLVIIFINIVF